MPSLPFETLRTASGREIPKLPLRRKDESAAPSSSSNRFSNSSSNSASNSAPNSAPNNASNSSSNQFLSHDAAQQDALLLYKAGEYYALKRDHEMPEPKGEAELLVQVITIGLNPVDWKGADFGFGQPAYPWINGRDFAGVVVRAPKNSASRIQKGNVVFGSSTDYRDIRKAAFQEYLIANDFNVSRFPTGGSAKVNEVAALGTAFIAAVTGLSICFGIDFSKIPYDDIPKGPNLLAEARKDSSKIPKDTHPEVMEGIPDAELPQAGEWIVVWGAGPAGQFFCQLAKFVGLRVACVDDLTQVGSRLANMRMDLMLDFKAHEPDRIVEIVRASSGGKLRFGVDTVGKKTAETLQRCVQPSQSGLKAHIAGLSGLPDEAAEGVVHHKALPIKLFHELPEYGEGVSKWLEDLIITDSIVLPEVEVAQGGLSGINDALDRLRKGELPGKRLVVPIRSTQPKKEEPKKEEEEKEEKKEQPKKEEPKKAQQTNGDDRTDDNWV